MRLGLTGAGQTIAFSDSHISAAHEVFGTRPPEILSNGPPTVPDENGGTVADDHGTAVVSVALGNSDAFIGTAPGAATVYGTYANYGNLIDLGERAIDRSAVAWNNSWGYADDNGTVTVAEANMSVAFEGNAGADYFDVLQRYAKQGVVVFAMSNDENEKNAGIMDALPFLRPGLEAGWLAAVNGVPTINDDGDVQSVQLLSSSCLQAARWCLVADGSWTVAYGPGVEYAITTGTSFAAPQISGALALLAEAFPDLTPHELRVRLLASAEDEFFTPDDAYEIAEGFTKGYSFTYGHGYLDIEAALKPIDGVFVPTPSGERISANVPVLMTGTGMGDALEVSLAETDLMVRDALSAGFVMPGRALTAAARPTSQAAAILSRSLAGNLQFERTRDVAALDDSFASFGGMTVNLPAADGLGHASLLVPQAGAESAGLQVARVLADGPLRVELGLKVARDDGQKLGLSGSDGAMMASMSLGLTQDLGGSAFLALAGEVGVTDLGGTTALGDTGTARFDSLSLTAGRSDVFSQGDRLSIGVGMPVAIASGETVIDLPVYRQGAAEAFEPVALNFAPENRQMDFGINYQAALAEDVEMKFTLAHSENFGNRAGVTDSGGAVAVTFRF